MGAEPQEQSLEQSGRRNSTAMLSSAERAKSPYMRMVLESAFMKPACLPVLRGGTGKGQIEGFKGKRTMFEISILEGLQVIFAVVLAKYLGGWIGNKDNRELF